MALGFGHALNSEHSMDTALQLSWFVVARGGITSGQESKTWAFFLTFPGAAASYGKKSLLKIPEMVDVHSASQASCGWRDSYVQAKGSLSWYDYDAAAPNSDLARMVTLD